MFLLARRLLHPSARLLEEQQSKPFQGLASAGRWKYRGAADVRKTPETQHQCTRSRADPASFWTWGSTWHCHKIIIYTYTSRSSGLHDSNLNGLANVPLGGIFIIAVKWDIVIEPRRVEGKNRPGRCTLKI